MSPHRQPPPQPRDFVRRFEEQLHWFLRHLDRQATLALLADLSDGLARERGAIQNLERSRAAMLARVTESNSYAELGEIEHALTALEIARFLGCNSVTGLHRGCTESRDLLAVRTVTLVAAELAAQGRGEPPLPFALISMGSDGREEQTLVTDQDYLLVYADGGGAAADEYFRDFSERLVERLAEVGFAKCSGDIMPSNPTWRGSRQQWRQRLMAIVRYEYEEYAQNLMDLIVLSDARFVAGDQALATDLIEMIRDFEQSYFQVIWGMARQATEMKVGLGMFGGFWTDRSGEFKGLLNLKLLGWAPLVMNVRILAVNSGIAATNTLQRIAMLEEGRRLSAGNAAELGNAYHVLTRHRILLQIRKLRSDAADSYHLDPEALDTREREELHQALTAIKDLQQVIRTNFSTM